MDKNKLLKYYFKLYLKGKELYDIDKDKSFEILKESLTVLDSIKKKYPDINEKYNALIEESENECYKLIDESIETNIESEIVSSNKIDTEILFNTLEKGDISFIKKAKYGDIDFKKKINDKSILHHAIKYSDITFLKLAFKLGARIDTTDDNGHTLLEYACLELDPNMINFLIKYGADMSKHLYFRKGTTKFINNYDSIDILILYKLLLSYNNKLVDNNIFTNKLILINNLLNLEEKIGLNDYTISDLLNWITSFLCNIENDSALDYLNIILEELNYPLKNKLGCPTNKIEIILTNLVPFIENYPFNLSMDWLFSLELKYLIINLIRKKKNINSFNIKTNDIKTELVNIIWNNYIKNDIIKEDYIGILISQWVSKIKV
jgi:ankyrin repeat protein